MTWVEEWLAALDASGIGLAPWLLAAARTLPTTLLVPALGLRAFPVFVRVIWALVLSATWYPVTVGMAAPGALVLDGSFVTRLLAEFVLGLPVGVGAAMLVWVSLMTGGIVDRLHGLRIQYELAEPQTGAFASLFTLASAYGFLQFGGVSFVAGRLASVEAPGPTWVELLTRVSEQVVDGIGIAVAIAAPMLVLALLVEIVLMVAARAARGANNLGALAPLRSLALLVSLYLVLPRLGQALALAFDFPAP